MYVKYIFNQGEYMGPLLSEQVCFALYSTTGVITRAYRELLSPHQLTYPQFVVMMALWSDNGASLSEVARRVGLTKGTVTPILKNLENSGYIKRKAIPGNDRMKSMVLTEKGRAFAQEADEITKQALCATGLTSDEAQTLIRLCSNIRANLE